MMLTSRDLGRPAPFIAPSWARKFTPDDLKVGRSIRSWEYGFWWIEWGGVLNTIKDNTTTIRHELYRIALGLWDYVKNSGHYRESANWTLDWIGAVPGGMCSLVFTVTSPVRITLFDRLARRRKSSIRALSTLTMSAMSWPPYCCLPSTTAPRTRTIAP